MDLSTNPLTNCCVYPVLVDNNDNKWLATGGSTTGQNLFFFDGINWQIYDFVVNGLTLDRQNSVWINTANMYDRIFYFSDTMHYLTLPTQLIWSPDNNVILHCLAFDNNNCLLIGGNMGMAKRNLNGTWEYFSHSYFDIPEDEYISGIYIDPQDNIWISTINNGIVKHDGQNVTHFNSSTTNCNIDYMSVFFIDSFNNLWIAPFGRSTVYKFDGNTWISFTTENHIPSNGLWTTYIQSISEDLDHNIWIATGQGLCKINTNGEWTIYTTENSGICSDDVQSIDFDSQNNVWIGTSNGMCVYRQNANTIEEITSQISNQMIFKNYPNPFNPSTTISFNLDKSEKVSIHIYNIKGQLIKSLVDKLYEKGTHSIIWDGKNNIGKNCGSGVFLCKIIAGNKTKTKKMLMIK